MNCSSYSSLSRRSSLRRLSWIALLGIGFAGVGVVGSLRAQDDPLAQVDPLAKEKEGRGLVARTDEAFAGYTLITPLLSKLVFLLDMDGNEVHRWTCDLPPGNSVYLRDNGNLLRAERPENDVFSGGGIGGRVCEYSWEGEKLWQLDWATSRHCHHHDIEPLPNGNVLLISWDRKNRDQALMAGRDPALMPGTEFWPDSVIEIEPTFPVGGKVVWEWHVWDHLIQDHDPEKENYGDVAKSPSRVDINADRMFKKPPPKEQAAENEKLRQLGYLGGSPSDEKGRGGRNTEGADWLHTNGIDYNVELDQIVLSVRSLNEVWVIDHSTTTAEAQGATGGRWGKGGELLYRWGNPHAYRRGPEEAMLLHRQHDAQWVEPGCPGAGNLMVFNNGRERPGTEYSTALEFTPPLGDGGYAIPVDGALGPSRPTWEYGHDESERFYSSFISGVQRLPNGNTLICSGSQGRVFEVTPDRRVVWDLLSTYGGDAPMGPPGGAPRPRAPSPSDDGTAPPPPPPARGNPGGMTSFGLFRATRLAADHPGLSRL